MCPTQLRSFRGAIHSRYFPVQIQRAIRNHHNHPGRSRIYDLTLPHQVRAVRRPQFDLLRSRFFKFHIAGSDLQCMLPRAFRMNLQLHAISGHTFRRYVKIQGPIPSQFHVIDAP